MSSSLVFWVSGGFFFFFIFTAFSIETFVSKQMPNVASEMDLHRLHNTRKRDLSKMDGVRYMTLPP